MAITVEISTDGLPTWVFILTYFGVGPSLTLGFKFLFGADGLGFHFPLFTVWCLLYLEWLLARFVRKKSNVDDENGFDELVSLPNQSVRCMSGMTVRGLGRLVGICLATEIACANLSLLTLSVSFHTMAKASTPAYVLVFATLLGLETLSFPLAGVVLAIVVGVALCSMGEISFALSGFTFINVAAAAGGLRWAATHLYLGQTSAAVTRGGALELLYRSLPAALVLLPPLVVTFELRSLIAYVSASPSSVALLFRLTLLLLTFALGGFAMVMVEMVLVHRLSSLTFSIMSIAKELLVILLSVALYGDQLTLLNWAGFTITLAGIVAFRRLRSSQERGAPPPPTLPHCGSADLDSSSLSRSSSSSEYNDLEPLPSDEGGEQSALISHGAPRP
jgi:solute carrier family 35 protein C2